MVRSVFLWVVSAALLAACAGEPAGDAVETASASAVGNGSTIFTDVTDASGLGGFRHVNGAFGERLFPESMGAGAGFLDYDGDGHLDVVLVAGSDWPDRGDPIPALELYRNDGGGSFERATAEAGLGDLHAYGMGVAVADYDNDGDDDLYFTTLSENVLLRNDEGVFSDVTAEAGLAHAKEWSTAALFFDADLDGYVDLWVGQYVDWSPENDLWCSVDGERASYCTPEIYPGVGPRFYRNNGDGTFTERTAEAGFADAPGKTLGAVETDYNGDGWSDLYVANDTEPDQLYANNGDGTFSEIGVRSGVALDERGKARAGMGLDAGRVDPDAVTFFVGNFTSEMVGVYRYEGSGFFAERAAASGIGGPTLPVLTFGLFLFDPDLDGDLDLFVANGHIEPEIGEVQEGVAYRQPAQLFLNDGSGSFTLRDVDDALATPMVARGAAYGDVDADGDQDVLITENGAGARLLRNDHPQARYLRVHLVGTRSNRDAVGADVTVVAGGRRMVRRVKAGGSYLSASEKTVTIGLGSGRKVDTLRIDWPDGSVETFADVPVNVEATIVQDRGIVDRAVRSATAARRGTVNLPNAPWVKIEPDPTRGN